MADHCIDCEHCGQDRRVVGDHDSYGYWNGKVDASDVVKMLKKREGKVLKPGRAKPQPKTVSFDD
jgi:hypothetical protein